MADVTEDSGHRLDRYRDYLRLLARMQLPHLLRGKLDPSDLVQQTLMRAYQSLEQFRGHSDAEMASWLRQILTNALSNAVRDYSRACRDVRLERSLEGSIEQSSARLEAWLASNEISPRDQLERSEQLIHLTQSLASLPDLQREVLILRYCQGVQLADIGEQLGRSRASVASLLRRGLRALRSRLNDQ